MWLRLNIVLLIALVISAVLLVRQSHDGRTLFAELERAKSEGRKLEADRHRLNAEREGEATNQCGGLASGGARAGGGSAPAVARLPL